MKARWVLVFVVMAVVVALESGCATKKYVRNRIAERVQPLENRTTELEETSRRNTQQISQLSAGVDEVRTRAGRAQETADRAASAAEQANARVTGIESSVEDLRTSLDRFSVQNTSIVFFKPGSAILTPEAMAQLDTVASQLGDGSGIILEIVGFGDTARATRQNEMLAQMRAEAVQRYLADKKNFPVMRMFAVGFGAARPLTSEQVSASASTTQATQPTTTTDTRIYNRRVEIRVLTNNAVKGTPPRAAAKQAPKTS